MCARCVIGDISTSSCEVDCRLSRFTELQLNEDPPSKLKKIVHYSA